MTEPLRHLFTAAEADRILGIPAGTVRAWASRKQIWPYGLDEQNRPMYDRDHLMALRDARKPVPGSVTPRLASATLEP